MKKETGGKKYWRWGVIVFALLGGIVVYRFFRAPQLGQWRDPVIETHDRKITELGNKAKDLSKLMVEAEKTGDKGRYMELAKKAALNQIELDQEWKSLHASLRVRQLGNLKYPQGDAASSTALHTFTESEKLELLTKEYALDLASLKLLKAQIGIMFSNEFRGKVLEEIHDTLVSEDF